MKLSTKLISAVFAASIISISLTSSPLWAVSAFAQGTEIVSAKTIVNQAKTDGLVGEKLNGYLGFVTQDVSGELLAAVNEINMKRKTIYTRFAKEQKVGVSDAAGLTGEKLVAKAKLGEMVMLGDNQWRAAGS